MKEASSLSERSAALEWTDDERIDPRIRTVFAAMRSTRTLSSVVPSCRAEALAIANTSDARAYIHAFTKALDTVNALSGAHLVPLSAPVVETKLHFVSQPDGNRVSVNLIAPRTTSDTTEIPAVMYFHGGGMSSFSCFCGNFRSFGRLIATHGVAVLMVDFRNAINPAQDGEPIAAFPGGLNDTVSAVRWATANHRRLGIRPHVVLAGESGGGNLAIATALKLKRDDGNCQLIDGLYVMCPFISGKYPCAKYPSSSKHAGIILSTEAMATYAAGYGDGLQGNALAWPACSTVGELTGLPRVAISLNEYDPLLDEGLHFYRNCLKAGVSATCTIIAGTVHGTGNFFPGLCPDISKAMASAIASMCNESTGLQSNL